MRSGRGRLNERGRLEKVDWGVNGVGWRGRGRRWIWAVAAGDESERARARKCSVERKTDKKRSMSVKERNERKEKRMYILDFRSETDGD